MSGIVNVGKIDTNPGSGVRNPFTPPDIWDGDEQEYLELMRNRYHDIEQKQQMLTIVRRYERSDSTYSITGPYASEAIHILSLI